MAFTVNKKAFCVLEFAKTESIMTVQRRFRIMYHTEPPTKQFVNGTWNSSRVATCALRNEVTFRAHRLRLTSVCEKSLSGAPRSQQLARASSCKVGQNLGEILYLLICFFLPCLSWLLRSQFSKSRRDFWITLYFIQIHSEKQRDTPVEMSEHVMLWSCRLWGRQMQ